MPLGETLRRAFKTRDRSRESYFGLYPFAWKPDWEDSIEKLHRYRAPQETLTWVNQVSQWPFERIVPCHLSAPLSADAQVFRQAFSFLYRPGHRSDADPLPEEDFELLYQLDKTLTKRGITPPAKPL